MPAVGGTTACASEPAVGGRAISAQEDDNDSCPCATCWPAAFMQRGVAWGIDGKVAAGEGASGKLVRKFTDFFFLADSSA